jgi:hypothetical protein
MWKNQLKFRIPIVVFANSGYCESLPFFLYFLSLMGIKSLKKKKKKIKKFNAYMERSVIKNYRKIASIRRIKRKILCKTIHTIRAISNQIITISNQNFFLWYRFIQRFVDRCKIVMDS